MSQNNSKVDTSQSRSLAEQINLQFSTLGDLLETRFHQTPNKIIYNFVETTLKNKQSITYKELYLKASYVAQQLQIINPEKKPVLLLFNCDINYLIAFFGCILAGQIAVPAYPPTASKHFDRLQSIIESSEARVALSTVDIHSLMKTVDSSKLSQFSLTIHQIDEFAFDENLLIPERQFINSEDIAFLQYTSGSTGEPKGVMLSHKSLLTNLKMIKTHYNYSSQDVIAMWLPLYHDMGLIAGVLTTLFINAELYFMPPHSIVRPFRWLKLMSDVRATVTGSPNFAYEMCLHRVSDDELKQLDLSSLRFLASGAEPVRSETARKFQERFEKVGLRRNTILPCYGLAEACVWATSRNVEDSLQTILVDPKILQDSSLAAPVDTNKKNKIEYVSCGILDSSSIVVNPQSLDLKNPFEVGELLISGEHLMSGYWKNPEATVQAFVEVSGQKYLRTGDLVFTDNDKNIYFCGRNKDMIIVRGKNYYATDLETSISRAHPVFRGMVNAVFYHDNNEKECVVLVQEIPHGTLEKEFDFLKNQIQQIVIDEHNLHFDEIIFTLPGLIKRTSAGKVRRLATRDLFLKSEIRPYKQSWTTSSSIHLARKKIKLMNNALLYGIAKMRSSIR